MCPLPPNPKRLLCPCPEADLFDDGRRDDFLSREGAPRHGIRAASPFLFSLLPIRHAVARREIASRVTCVEGYVLGVLAGGELGAKRQPVGSRKEQLHKGLLENEAASRAPAEHLVVAPHPVDSRLARNRPPSLPVQLQQLLLDRARLLVESFLRPGDGGDLAQEVLDEEVGDVGARAGVAPELDGGGDGHVQADAVAVDLAVGRGPGVAPAAVRVVVPRCFAA